MTRKIVLMAATVAGSLALAACASQPNGTNRKTADQAKTHMVCFSTYPVGSHIAKTQCMSEQSYAEYKKAEEKQAQTERARLQQAQQQDRTGVGGDGGTPGGGI